MGSDSRPAVVGPGTGDDRLDSPSVTPLPAPPDDQLFRLAGVAAAVGAVAVLLGWRWARRNLVLSRRAGA